MIDIENANKVFDEYVRQFNWKILCWRKIYRYHKNSNFKS